MVNKKSEIQPIPKATLDGRSQKKSAEKRMKLSTQTLLNRFFGSGVVGIFAGVLSGWLIFTLNLPLGWFFITVGFSGFGLVMLVSAWFTRQGLVHSRLMKLMTRLMNLI